MASNIKAPKKLIEVALPLDDINEAAAREKSIRHGHPSTLHLWWARRPLAAARAVLFAQLVNDPGGERGYFAGKTKKQADQEREKLFDIIRDLVKWENSNNEAVLSRAREAIRQSWRETCELNKGKLGFDPDKLPAFHDPFAGGGAIPLEAQRLGLESYASDLNPVAILINKAMIEIPPKFAGRKPLGPIPASEKQIKLHEDWSGAKGLAEDVRRYGAWMREEAFKRIGHLYPQVEITTDMTKDRPDLKGMVGQKLTVIAWLWARTVKSPNPAFSHVEVPLASTFVLSSKEDKEAWVEPIIDGDSYSFAICSGKPSERAKEGTKAGGRGANFKCLLSDSPISGAYIKAEGQAGRMGARLMAIVAEGNRGRIYLSPTEEVESVARLAKPTWRPNGDVPARLTGGTCVPYGLKEWGDLFTPRQLVALTTFSDLVSEAREKVRQDAIKSGMADDGIGLEAGGNGATAYAEAIGVYLAFCLDKMTDTNTSLCSWQVDPPRLRATFGRQALPMVWDYAEANIFGDAAGDFGRCVRSLTEVLDRQELTGIGTALQRDAQALSIEQTRVFSTDPPYYDNIGYADLSDFFYVWLRRSLKPIYPSLFATLAVPKAEELVATPYRHGSKEAAEQFFLNGMTEAMHRLAEQSHSAFPVTIYYAFKQSESDGANGTVSTGWETFLDAVLKAGFSISGTWPMRSELATRNIGRGANALASSIVLVCRKRDSEAESISRREFQRELREEMPQALETMIGGSEGSSPIAPVDLAQAAIGPGMAIFSKYKAVLNQDGSPMSVHDALILINREITEFLNPDSGNYDNDTLFCSAWFDQYGWSTGPFGEADTLSRAKGTTVDGVKQAGIIESGGGKVRLMKWEEYPSNWDPKSDSRMPVWEATHQMIRVLNLKGEFEAGTMLASMPEKAEVIRQLAYHLYTLCERKKWAEEARAYNELITSWHGIVAASHDVGHVNTQQELLFG
jgi:putative DNA methylase